MVLFALQIIIIIIISFLSMEMFPFLIIPVDIKNENEIGAVAT